MLCFFGILKEDRPRFKSGFRDQELFRWGENADPNCLFWQE